MGNFPIDSKLNLLVVLGAAIGSGFLFWGNRSEAASGDEPVGETPVITQHLDQAAINDGRTGFRELFEAGEDLFTARFNLLDGEGRPAATGNGVPSPWAPRPLPEFIQSSGPTANSCAGCHFQPGIGGAGDFAVDVSVGANNLDPPVETFAAEVGNERNSLGMHGAGLIELLAREMTSALHAIRNQAISQARQTGQAVTLDLITKGVRFGQITALPDGTLNTDGVAFDLTRQGLGPRPERRPNGKVLVRAFTDLKRHVIGDQDFPHFLNERVIQAGVPTDHSSPGNSGMWATRRAMDTGVT